jgi:hypothetical protein
MGSLKRGEVPTAQDATNSIRALRTWLLGTIGYYAVRELTGLDWGYYIGGHPSEIVGLEKIPAMYDLPEAARIMPGTFPFLRQSKSMPMQTVEGLISTGVGGITSTLEGYNIFSDVIPSEARRFKEHMRWIPELNMDGIGGTALEFAVGMSAARGPGRWLETVTNWGRADAPPGFLRIGPPERPKQISKRVAVSRLFLPGGPYEAGRSWRSRRRDAAFNEWNKTFRAELLARYMHPETPAEERARLRRQAAGFGYDLKAAATSGRRYYGVPQHLRHFGAGDVVRRVRASLRDVGRYAREDQRVVHRLVFGKRAPFRAKFFASPSIRRTVKRLLRAEGGRQMLEDYHEAMGWGPTGLRR